MRHHSQVRNSASHREKMLSATILLFSVAFSFLNTGKAQTGVYTLNGGTASQSNQTYAATETDQSSVYVLNSGNLTLNGCTLTKTGDASDVNISSQYGTNAGVLATSSSIIMIMGGTVTTNASGANGLFATGTGSAITMTNSTISASGASAHGVDCTYGGTITLNNVNVTTTGSNSSVLATDFGGGTVTVTGGTHTSTATSSGAHSAGIYSTGTISVTDATVVSAGDCGGVIDGANSILLTNTDLTGALHGIKTWKTAPMTGAASISLSGGSLTALGGDAFYITGETGNAATTNITLSQGATISASTENIIHVVNSSTATLTADAESLSGNIKADESSTLSVNLTNGTNLTGSALYSNISLDETSGWTVTSPSLIRVITNPSGISGLTVTNITGNGNNVYYDSTLTGNAYLEGLTYSLVNGGVLTPGTTLATAEPCESLSTQPVLYTNYPNPAKGLTTLKYFLPGKTKTTLAVFNSLGSLVVMLADDIRESGEHKVTFDTSGLQEGIYFYRLVAGEVILTRKMILSK